jgi:GTP-binding protein
MRREGYEIQVGQPQVIVKHVDGEKLEPYENLKVSLPEEFSGKIIELAARRKGEMLSMERKGDRINVEFEIPSRGIIGLNSIVLTQTAGEAIMAHRFIAFKPWKGEIEKRINGSLIAMESGKAIPYAINKLQDRGSFFVEPGEDIYAGQVIGENTRQDDLVLNITKTKKLTNMRASGSDDKVQIAPAIKFSLEEALEYIQHDDYVEITPKSIRLRKILLDENDRKRSRNASQSH